jgi:hypothetical protein
MEDQSMGTRADFYLGKGKTAEWLGSIAWDGDSSICPQILNCTSDAAFRHAVASFLADREDGTTPDQGWPWAVEGQRGTTDCHYWFFDERCWKGRGECERYGEVYVPADEPEPDWSLVETAEDRGEDPDVVEAALYDRWLGGRDKIEFPDMSAKKNVTFGKRSGLTIIGSVSSGGTEHG